MTRVAAKKVALSSRPHAIPSCAGPRRLLPERSRPSPAGARLPNTHVESPAHALLNSSQGRQDGLPRAVGRHAAAHQSKDPPNLLLWQFIDQVMKLFTLHAHMTSLSADARPRLHIEYTAMQQKVTQVCTDL